MQSSKKLLPDQNHKSSSEVSPIDIEIITNSIKSDDQDAFSPTTNHLHNLPSQNILPLLEQPQYDHDPFQAEQPHRGDYEHPGRIDDRSKMSSARSIELDESKDHYDVIVTQVKLEPKSEAKTMLQSVFRYESNKQSSSERDSKPVEAYSTNFMTVSVPLTLQKAEQTAHVQSLGPNMLVKPLPMSLTSETNFEKEPKKSKESGEAIHENKAAPELKKNDMGEVAVQKDVGGINKKKERRLMKTVAIQTPREIDLVYCKDLAVYFWYLIYPFVQFVLIPLTILAIIYNPESIPTKLRLAFCFYGLLLGLLQIFILHEEVEIPMQNRISEIFSKYGSLAQGLQYRVVYWLPSLVLVGVFVGVCYAFGYNMDDIFDYSLSIESICIIGLVTLAVCLGVWLLATYFILLAMKFQNNANLENKLIRLQKFFERNPGTKLEKRSSTLDCYFIDKYSEFENKETKIRIQRIQQNLELFVQKDPSINLKTLTREIHGFVLQDCKIYIRSILSFLQIGFFLGQAIGYYHLITKLDEQSHSPFRFLIVIALEFFTYCSGNLFPGSFGLSPYLKVNKIMSLALFSAFFRFILLRSRDFTEMIGYLGIKYAVKGIFYLISIFCLEMYVKGSDLRDKDFDEEHHTRKGKDRQKYYFRFAQYWFRKYLMQTYCEIFFIIAMMTLVVGNFNLYPRSTTPILKLVFEDNDKFLIVSSVDAAIEIGLAFVMLVFMKLHARRRKFIKEYSVWEDVKVIFGEKRGFVFFLQIFALFLMLFIYFYIF